MTPCAHCAPWDMWPLGSGGPGTTGYDLSCREPGSALRSRYPHQPGSARPAAVPGLANIPAPAAAATSEAVSCGCQPRLPWPRVPGGGGGGGGTMVEAAQLHPRPLHGTRPRSHRHHTRTHHKNGCLAERSPAPATTGQNNNQAATSRPPCRAT